ncbi:MAG: hypothetical protein ACI32N_03430 [Bulleidia sp.]
MDRFSIELNQYLAKQEISNDEDLDAAISKFSQMYNDRIRSGRKTKLDIAIERFEKAKNPKEALSCAYKLLKLDPYHFKARIIVEISKCHSPVLAYSNVLSEEKERLHAEGYEVGKYYEIPETRDFIRGLYDFMDLLVGFKRYNEAVRIGESIMKYNTNDNTGSRFCLMHLYALLEEDVKANALYERASDNYGCMYLLPMACIAFKKNRLDQAEGYLTKLFQNYRDAKLYLRAKKNNRESQFGPLNVEGAFRPGTWEEIRATFYENRFLYDQEPEFMKWLYNHVSIRKK